jgi:hypothetical protein
MPKRSALRIHDVQKAIDWATNPPPEQAHMRLGLDAALISFSFSRPNYGLREAYAEGARLFEKAATKANELAFELEAQYLKIRENSLSIDEAWLDELAVRLLVLAQACHRWAPDASAGLYLENYLAGIPQLDADGIPVWSDKEEFKGLNGYDLYAARMVTASKHRGISRTDLLPVPQGKDARVPTWWVSDPKRMRTAALNLRRVSFKFQVFANQTRRSGGGRPQDGDRIQLIRSAQALGISIPALSFLMAAFVVKPSWHSNTPIPESLWPMRHGGRPAGILSKAERIWLETSQQEWFKRLNEASREKRRKRKRDEENHRRRMGE